MCAYQNIDQHSTDMDTNDSAASGPESSLSPSEAPEAAGVGDTEDSSTSESANPAPKINPLKWTVSISWYRLLCKLTHSVP